MKLWHRLKLVAMRFQRGVNSGIFNSANTWVSSALHRRTRGQHASVVMAPLLWMCRTFPEAPLVVEGKKGGEWECIDDHPMAMLIQRPNPFYSGELMATATILSIHLDGNAYWLKARSKSTLATEELWWVPSNEMTPRWPLDGTVFIDHYDYRPGGMGDPIRVEVEDVVHFRMGIDEENVRLGKSPLRSVLREVLTDEEAADFAQTILANCGIPGVIISPDGEVELSDEEFKAAKVEFESRFSGRNRGRPFVASSKTNVQQFGFSPEQMDMRTLRRVPEERVSAVLGVAAIVAGLGAGLDRSTFANFSEAREASYDSAIIPLQRILAAEIRHQLLPDFETNLDGFRVKYDLTDVRILQEDENAKTTRKLAELTAGAITLATYLRETGREALPIHDVYLRNMSVVEVPADELNQPTPPSKPIPPELLAHTPPQLDADGNPIPPASAPVPPVPTPPKPDPVPA